MPFGGFSGKGFAPLGFFPPAGILLEISRFPTSARASSASSPEGFTVVSLCSDEAPLVASCSWGLEASCLPESSEESSEACPPHAAARSTTMPSKTTAAGFFPLRLFSQSFFRRSALQNKTFHFLQRYLR